MLKYKGYCTTYKLAHSYKGWDVVLGGRCALAAASLKPLCDESGMD